MLRRTGSLLRAHDIGGRLLGALHLASAHAVALFLHTTLSILQMAAYSGGGGGEHNYPKRAARCRTAWGRKGGIEFCRTWAACFLRLASRDFSRWLPRAMVVGLSVEWMDGWMGFDFLYVFSTGGRLMLYFRRLFLDKGWVVVVKSSSVRTRQEEGRRI